MMCPLPPKFRGPLSQYFDLIARCRALALFALATCLIINQGAFAVDREEGLSGEVNVGGSLATGNTDTTHLNAEMRARFTAGRLEDNYRLMFEFADDNGTTTAQRILASAESRFDVSDGLFVFGFLQYDDDRFSGYQYEIEGTVGAGYKLIDRSDMRFLVQAGVGYRFSELSGLGVNEDEFTIRSSAELEYDLSDTTSLSNVSIVTWDSSRVKLENTIAVTSELFASLSSRISFNIRYNDDAPPSDTQDGYLD